MRKIKLKQGTLAWEKAREARIGSSEVFDIIRYYATDNELQNCGLNAEVVRSEKPHTTVWALYHKLLGDGLYQKGILPPELSEYGHAVEAYGAAVLQEGRALKLKRGEVFIDDRLIASLDISGIGEEIDVVDFGGKEMNMSGKRFVCEQKSVMPNVLKNGLPIKYVFQAQYQITMTKADFFILQVMVLENDTIFERGRITQIARQGLKKLRAYLDGKIRVTHLYFANNEVFAALIKTCLKRFYDDVDNRREPSPFLPYDSQKNIIESIRINSFYNKATVYECDLLQNYALAKAEADAAEDRRINILQYIIDTAKNYNVSKFSSPDGYYGSFSANGAFLLKPPKEDV